MAKKKYYAVKAGKTPGIYETWDECQNQTKGFSGAQFKAFATLKEAENYIVGEEDVCPQEVESADAVNTQIEQKLQTLTESEIVAFVDGSYNAKEEKSGFGAILIDYKGVKTPLYKAFNKQFHSEFLEMNNVAAELEGVKEAIKWAIAYGKTKITIYYDYEGIGKWADGLWQANKELTRQYVSFIREKRTLITMEFIKVPAHSGIEYNELADTWAKRSLLEKGYKTYDNGAIYFLGFSSDDWTAIVECINEEHLELKSGYNRLINIQKEKLDNRERLAITDGINRVAINCYSGGRCFVQGKQTVLFQKIIAFAVELMQSEQTVVEMLNRIHVVTITKEEVERKFEQLLPGYAGERRGKLYNNVLTAVYNTMWTGYMPDYTSLITPIFRAYEYYLHRILGDVMQLNTCNANGSNHFGYFNKDDSGRFVCTSSETTRLTVQQVDYLNDLYNEYHGVRHPYTHWSVDDYDTAVITTIEIAQEYLMKGLELIERYYSLF